MPDTTPTTPADETEEQRIDREQTERAHAEGEHAFCGVTCEATFPSDMLRNGILCRAVPGSATMLDELLRRAARLVLGTTDQQPTTVDRAAVLTSTLREVLDTFGPMTEVYGGPVAYYDGSADITPAQYEGWRAVLDDEPSRMADEAQQPECTSTPCPHPGDCRHGCRAAADELSREAQPATDQPTEALCGKTLGIGFPNHPYRPCARPAGHAEAYCRDATEQHHFLAATDRPDTETEAAK
ncbi:hypothetical protein ACGFZA_07595 [Streptomyces sp. NPDC048211]|uniref:hypothetical protein n=1 Tax=Streptomyces sp. NPDC048211 TaxID=3365516 RepID=UPI0037130E93